MSIADFNSSMKSPQFTPATMRKTIIIFNLTLPFIFTNNFNPIKTNDTIVLTQTVNNKHVLDFLKMRIKQVTKSRAVKSETCNVGALNHEKFKGKCEDKDNKKFLIFNFIINPISRTLPNAS